jgi:Xaa-Pro dipeptidase
MTAHNKYPAKEHARRTVRKLEELAGAVSDAVIYLASSKTIYWPYCDQTQPIRQSRYFMYFTGVDDIPDCHVVYDIAKDALTLYLPPVDEESIMWSGLPVSLKQALATYDVDDVKHSTDLEKDLKAAGKVISIELSEEYPIVQESSVLLEALDETRMIKDDYELDLMRKAAQISDNSHLAVMSALPIETNEGHIHAEFIYHSMRQGSKIAAYSPICCSGTDCGTLHYVKNDQPLDNKQLVLIDAGAEWKTYASDVTRVFPINGEWTKEARAIFDAVKDMQTQTMNGVKPGVEWDDLHLLAHKILIQHFLKLGIFVNGSEQDILASRVSTAFLPHGLGHMLGMDTHDTGGKANYDDPDVMFRYLRIRRKLQANMVVTVEPGIYFNKFLIEPFKSDPIASNLIDWEVLATYMPVGGIRLEDDVRVTEIGFENFTKITRDADEISRIVKAGIQKGRSHFHVIA